MARAASASMGTLPNGVEKASALLKAKPLKATLWHGPKRITRLMVAAAGFSRT